MHLHPAISGKRIKPAIITPALRGAPETLRSRDGQQPGRQCGSSADLSPGHDRVPAISRCAHPPRYATVEATRQRARDQPDRDLARGEPIGPSALQFVSTDQQLLRKDESPCPRLFAVTSQPG